MTKRTGEADPVERSEGGPELSAYPSSRCSPEAGAALRRLIRGEEAGDFEDFCVEGHSARYVAHCAT
ncbi:hypothetical protein ABZ918_23680 [Streptomyces viridosporus]|uniref:hypothetical protein n=1 Tax=Streptomyces viridosporus TaxID=67581 RepID=UPI0034251ECB